VTERTITAEEIKKKLDHLLIIRQAARTDLLYLCNKILEYPDVTKEVHGPIIDRLQKFHGGTEHLSSMGIIGYKPKVPIHKLARVPHKDKLFLDPRGNLKTTVITIAHSIQWILNYPDVRIALSMAIGDQTKKVMTEIKGHFQYNKTFRMVFPDYCPPPKRVNDWGNMEEFTVAMREKMRKEPTLCLITIGKVIAGSHYDVVKHSDLVDENNVKTPNQIADVISHFGHMDPLIERYPTDNPEEPAHGWQDVEGTRYDFGDLYGMLLDSKEWDCHVRSVYRPDGTTLDMRRFPPAEVDRIRRKPEVTPYIFSCQYENNPIPPEGGLCDPKDIVFVPRQFISNILPGLRIHCTIDLHGMESSLGDNDYTVLTVAGFDRDGRMYVLDVRRKRFTPDQVIGNVFDVYDKWKPIDFKIEKDAHARVLLPFLHREASKRQRFPTMVPIKRDNRTSKQQRIRGLQPWFKAGVIRFADDLPCKTDLIREIMQFPSQSSGVHDDILDTLADQMQNQEGGVNDDVVADMSPDLAYQFGLQKPRDKFLGFNDDGTENWLYGGDTGKGVYSPTGFLQ